MDLSKLTIKEAREALKKRKFSSYELVSSCLDRITAIDRKVKAYITICKQEACQMAKRVDDKIAKGVDKDKSLLGIPIAVKDNYCTKGIKTTAAARVLEDYIPVYDATVVARLKEAGAIIIGKTNMDAWAHGSSTETSEFFTTCNPWDLTRLPGGSSGGSAAAVAADEVIGAVGSETAGSIRQPAAWCGVVGLKPTYGRVSRYGLIAMASSTDCPGPITKTVEDAAIILQVIAGKDKFDSTTADRVVADYSTLMNQSVTGLTVGVPKEYFFAGMDKEVVDCVLKAVKYLAEKGVKIKKVSLLDPKYSVAVYTIIQRAEVSSNLARYDGIRYGKERNKFGEEAKRRIMFGAYTLSAGYYDKYYLKAQKVRSLIAADFERVFKKVDLLIAPTSPTPALKLGASKDDPLFGEMQDILVEASSMVGLPGLNLRCGFSKDNLPIGLQIIGPQFSEELLFKLGHFYQQETDWGEKKPKIK